VQVTNRLRLASGVASGDGLIVGDTFDLPPPLAWSSAELVSGVCAPCSSCVQGRDHEELFSLARSAR
jgi:hypothetical protein